MYVGIDSPYVDGDHKKAADLQYLLFLLRRVSSEDDANQPCYAINRKKIQGFVLLPPSVSVSGEEIAQLFIRNGFEILDNRSSSQIQGGDDGHTLIDIVELAVISRHGNSVFPSIPTPFIPVSVESGHEEQVRQLFGEDVAVYSPEDYATSFLCRAINGGNVGSIESLLTVYQNIQYKNINGETPLHFASRRRDCLFLKLLLKHDFDVNAKSKNGSTPLHFAAQEGDSDIVSLLLENGAAINARRRDGSTSLYLAIVEGKANVAELLLKCGADVNIGKDNGLTPLHAACRRKLAIIHNLLEKGAFINASATYCHAKGITPLTLAVERKDLKSVKCLLKFGADVNIPCYNDQTILKLAVDLKCPDIVEEILKCHPDLTSKINNQVLYESMLKDEDTSAKIAQMLSQYGFGVDVGTDNSSEFLHRAVCDGYTNVVERLIKSGVSVNKVYRFYDENRKEICTTNPLFTAIQYGRTDIVKLLIHLGADVQVRFELQDHNETLMEVAIEYEIEEAVKILMNDDTFVHSVILNESWDYFVAKMIQLTDSNHTIQKLLLKCVKVHGLDSLTEMLLHSADNGHLPGVVGAVKFGVFIDKRDSSGKTALHKAALSKKSSEIIVFLIRNNANIEARCFSGKTPLITAAENGKSMAVKELLKYGANIYSVDSFGCSPLHYVVAEGHTKVFEQILGHFFTDRDFIVRANIPQLLSFSHLSSLREDGEDAYLYKRFTKNKAGFKTCTFHLKFHLLRMKAAFSSEENVVLLAEKHLESIASGEYVCDSFERTVFRHDEREETINEETIT